MRREEPFYNCPSKVGKKTPTVYQASTEDCKAVEAVIIVVIFA